MTLQEVGEKLSKAMAIMTIRVMNGGSYAVRIHNGASAGNPDGVLVFFNNSSLETAVEQALSAIETYGVQDV